MKGKRLSKEEFVELANKIHKNKYDYSKVDYINKQTKICIVCPVHGEFWQSPNNHLSNNGCPKCWKERNLTSKLSNTEDFIKKAKAVHGDKYDYSKVNYKHSLEKICIICPKHGEFWQTPNMHLNGEGCPTCSESTLEKKVRNILDNEKIEYIPQYKTIWLNKQSLDFYLPKYNIAIECQGIQHFKPIDYFGGENGYKTIVTNDLKKNNLCKKYGIKILYYTSNKNNTLIENSQFYCDNIYFEEKELIKNVK